MKQRKVPYDIASASFYLYYHHKDDDYLDMNKMTNLINLSILLKYFLILS